MTDTTMQALFDFPRRGHAAQLAADAVPAQQMQVDPPLVEAAADAEVLHTSTREITGMVRGTDAMESQGAALQVAPKRTEIQTVILAELRDRGPMTDRELERLRIFCGLAPSTVRKRRSELTQTGTIVRVGRRDGMAVWDLITISGTMPVPAKEPHSRHYWKAKYETAKCEVDRLTEIIRQYQERDAGSIELRFVADRDVSTDHADYRIDP